MGQRAGGIVLELHEVEVARNNVQISEVSLLNHVTNWNGVIITDRVVERSTVQEVKLWLEPMQRRERRLRVDVDRQNAVSVESHLLREVRRGRRFTRATFEVDDRNHL